MGIMYEEALYAVWILTQAGQCTAKTYKALKAFPSFRAVYQAKAGDFDRAVFTQEESIPFLDKDTRQSAASLPACRQKNFQLMTFYDDHYPRLLRLIEQPPLVLFVRGTLPETDTNPSLTIVGSRQCSMNAKKFTFNITRELALCNFVIVSGIAQGVDTFAQKGVLCTRRPNIAVVPCGVDVDYSTSSREIYDLTMQNGAIISEYLPGSLVHRSNFAARNRILSGISHGMLIVEGSATSGTMLSANYAIEQGKTLFAVPGSPYSKLSEGPNALIADGCLVCRSSRDILDAYDPKFHDKLRPLEEVRREIIAGRYAKLIRAKTKPATYGDRRKIYTVLAKKASSLSEICAKLGLPTEIVETELETLKLSDCVEECENGVYKLK